MRAKTLKSSSPPQKKPAAKKVAVKKVLTKFRPQIRSRHPSHDILREELPKLPFRSVIRLGSDWAGDDKHRVEINSVDAISNSADKLAMKQCFSRGDVMTAEWVRLADWNNQFDFPVVLKNRFGSRGEGNTLIKSAEEMRRAIVGKTNNNYIVEKYHDYVREYRLHVTADGCFYTCRKLLREDTPEGQRWYRNDSNSVWVVEDNPSFDRPSNWAAIVTECVKALNATGLDFGACDVRVQGARTKTTKLRTSPKFFIVEINSAPSFGAITTQKYLEMLPKLLKKKYDGNQGKTTK